ncbi:hypothetical protein C9374_004996 [Naegleria lovaniensis]|uniref:Uncharacterized protein n=1 Tax=Naegleria lovaniensis TaxID=51637 RepID=A0AA88KIP0_NAELO|nr:uncharacterized protein C9374_004996 [Naegleria lovaniensis]KAG2383029.1 hypothetical protein C9374_004996 [Naegleria lovaniensis]
MEKRFDEKLEQAEKRFISVFKEHRQDYNKLDIKVFIDSYNEKSLSLNALLEVDKSLMNDPHFLEMIKDVNRFCSDEYCKRVAPIDKIYVFVAGTLKALLRDCISLYSDVYIRKEMIEKAYSWYRDKRRKLLEFRLAVQQQDMIKQQRNSKSSQKHSARGGAPPVSSLPLHNLQNASQQAAEPSATTATATSQRNSTVPTDQPLPSSQASSRYSSSHHLFIPSYEENGTNEQQENLLKYVDKSTKRDKQNAGHPLDPRVISFDVLSKPSNDPKVPFYASEEKKRKAVINHKLKQYCKRNLAKSYDERMSGTYLTSVNTNQSVTDEKTQSARAGESSKSTLIDTHRSQVSSKVLLGASLNLASSQLQNTKDVFSMYADEIKGTGSVEHIMQNWAMYRAKEAEEQIEELEFRDAVHSWRINRARIEEEIQRRLESQWYSSQTGSVVHKIRDYKLPTLIKRDNLLEDSSDEEDERRPRSAASEASRKSVMSRASRASRIEDDETESIADSELMNREESSTFLSPYSTNPCFLKQSDISPDVSEAPSQQQHASTTTTQPIPPLPPKGFTTPKTVDLTSSSPMTPYFVNEFVQIPRSRPATSSISSARNIGPISSATTLARPATSGHATRGHNSLCDSTSQHKVISHNVFELYAKQQQEKNNQKKKRAPSEGKKQAPPAKSGKTTADTKKKPDASIQASSPDQTSKQEQVEEPLGGPPTLQKNIAMDQCEKIKILLSKEGVFIPSSTLRRAIIIPEDRPLEECLKALPKSSSTVVYEDVVEPVKKKKESKKKKKGRRVSSAKGSARN